MMTDTVTETVGCGDCGTLLSAKMLAPGIAETPCPTCGSTKKHIRVNLSDEVNPARDALEGKLRDVTRRSKEKVRHKFFCGWQVRKSQGDFIYKEWEVNRDTGRYREFIREESGEVIKDVEEALPDHVGHGSDKFKPTT